MTSGKYMAVIVLAAAIAWTAASCGKEDGGADGKQVRDQAETSSVTDLAKQSMPGLSVEDEFLEGRQMIEEAGFTIRSYRDFPAQEVTMKGRMLVYTDKGKKHSGVVYLKKVGGRLHPSWHWYFEDMVPDSVLKREINGDGLWDVRMVASHGKTVDFLQDDSFTLMGPERSDWIAMNGESSPPVSKENELWKAFDGDTTTAWKSAPQDVAFIELAVPFGVRDGVLRIATLSSEQPERCVVYADGKRVGEVELQPVAGRQEIALDAGIRGAKSVRLEFPSVRGGGNVVAVAELSLR